MCAISFLIHPLAYCFMLDDCRLIFANASSWCATEVWYPSSQDLTAMYQLHRWNVSVGGG